MLPRSWRPQLRLINFNAYSQTGACFLRYWPFSLPIFQVYNIFIHNTMVVVVGCVMGLVSMLIVLNILLLYMVRHFFPLWNEHHWHLICSSLSISGLASKDEVFGLILERLKNGSTVHFCLLFSTTRWFGMHKRAWPGLIFPPSSLSLPPSPAQPSPVCLVAIAWPGIIINLEQIVCFFHLYFHFSHFLVSPFILSGVWLSTSILLNAC